MCIGINSNVWNVIKKNNIFGTLCNIIEEMRICGIILIKKVLFIYVLWESCNGYIYVFLFFVLYSDNSIFDSIVNYKCIWLVVYKIKKRRYYVLTLMV